MARYRAQQVIVDAHQWDGTDDTSSWPDWLLSALGTRTLVFIQGGQSPLRLLLQTPEGRRFLYSSDWIIKGVRDTYNSVSDSVFNELYVPVGN